MQIILIKIPLLGVQLLLCLVKEFRTKDINSTKAVKALSYTTKDNLKRGMGMSHEGGSKCNEIVR